MPRSIVVEKPHKHQNADTQELDAHPPQSLEESRPLHERRIADIPVKRVIVKNAGKNRLGCIRWS
jgi:hypothetical protein